MDTEDKAAGAVRDRVFHLVSSLDLYSDQDDTAYMNLWYSDGNTSWSEVHGIRSPVGRSKLMGMYLDRYSKLPSSQGLNDGIDALEARARCTVVPIGLRTMPFEKGFALDLCDERRSRVIVSPGDWEISTKRQPCFRRGAGEESLARPVTGGSLETLRGFLNIDSDADWSLLLGWLVYALQPKGPYPILVIQGEHGSCKSTATRLFVSLTDPNEAPLLSLPKNERDLMVIARSRHVLAFDNLSTFCPEIKNALCRLATGNGHAARKLYSDGETVVWKASRPLIINGIASLLVSDDLADRAISITLPFVPENQRLRESELWERFERARFEILGALLDAAAYALEAPPPPSNIRLPRMADFAHFGASASCAWGVGYEDFLESYRDNRLVSIERGLDNDPLAQTIRAFLGSTREWRGTNGELLKILRQQAASQDTLEYLPANARGLGPELRRLAPALRSVGVEISEEKRSSKGYRVRLRLVDSASDVGSEHHEHSTLLNLGKEKRERKRSGCSQSSQHTLCSPQDYPNSTGGMV